MMEEARGAALRRRRARGGDGLRLRCETAARRSAAACRGPQAARECDQMALRDAHVTRALVTYRPGVNSALRRQCTAFDDGCARHARHLNGGVASCLHRTCAAKCRLYLLPAAAEVVPPEVVLERGALEVVPEKSRWFQGKGRWFLRKGRW